MDVLAAMLQEKGWDIIKKRVERATSEDLSGEGVLLLASGTWNTGGIEGQLNPYMHRYLKKFAKDAELGGRKVACVGLGDDRYRYTCKSADLLEEYVQSHGGELACEALRIVNEPYEQEDKINEWADALHSSLSA